MSPTTNKIRSAPAVETGADTAKIHNLRQNDYTTSQVLTQQHFDMLKASAIADEVIKERGYKTISNAKELADLGFSSSQQRVPGLLLPLHTTIKD